MSEYMDPTQYDVIPKQWKVIDHPVLGKVVAAMLPYPTLDAGAACAGDPAWTDDTVKYTRSPGRAGGDHVDTIQGAYMRATCSTCPLLVSCREYAIAHEDYGVWGATFPPERRAIRKDRRQLLVEPHSSYEYDLNDNYFDFLMPGGDIAGLMEVKRAESAAH